MAVQEALEKQQLKEEERKTEEEERQPGRRCHYQLQTMASAKERSEDAVTAYYQNWMAFLHLTKNRKGH